jgi:hypothetical protein
MHGAFVFLFLNFRALGRELSQPLQIISNPILACIPLLAKKMEIFLVKDKKHIF